MMSSYIRRLLKLGPLMGDMVVSAAGCFVFMRGFQLVATGKERPDTRSSMPANGRSLKPLAGIPAF